MYAPVISVGILGSRDVSFSYAMIFVKKVLPINSGDASFPVVLMYLFGSSFDCDNKWGEYVYISVLCNIYQRTGKLKHGWSGIGRNVERLRRCKRIKDWSMRGSDSIGLIFRLKGGQGLWQVVKCGSNGAVACIWRIVVSGSCGGWRFLQHPATALILNTV